MFSEIFQVRLSWEPLLTTLMSSPHLASPGSAFHQLEQNVMKLFMDVELMCLVGQSRELGRVPLLTVFVACFQEV